MAKKVIASLVVLLLIGSVVSVVLIRYRLVANTLRPVSSTSSPAPSSSFNRLNPLPTTSVPLSSRSVPESDCSWTISGDTNVELLVTSPSGQQEGYLQASNRYVSNIPGASYGIERGIGDDTGQSPPLPDSLQFGMNNAENGIYQVQIIPKRQGKYRLDVTFACGGGANLKTNQIPIDGMVSKNQIDKYAIIFPGLSVQKISK